MRLVLCVAFVAVAFSAGCSRKKKNDISEAKLRVGYIPITECAHLYVGISKGYFQKEGLQIELQPMKGGAVILPALQTGDLDIGFANVVSILAIDSVTNPSSGKFLKSLAGGTYERADHINHALLVKKDSRLEAKDLATTSVRIAVNTTKNIEELMLRRFLEMEGVHKPVLTLVSIGFPDMLPALDRGDVDVVSVVEPFIQPALRTGRYKLLATQYLKVSTNTAVATYAVTSQWLKANRDIAARFRRAFGRANDFINSNEPETREILASFTRIRREDLPLIGMPAFEAQLKRSALEELQEPMQRLNFISSPPPLDAILTDSE